LLHLLREKGVAKVRYHNFSGMDKKYLALPGSDELNQNLPTLPGSEALLVFVDCADLARVGNSFSTSLTNAFSCTLNIDHHISNTNFGTINWVDATASSTSEMIGRLAIMAGSSGNAAMATCLLAGIVGDTGSFSYSQTTAETFEMAAFLMRSGASLTLVGQKLGSRLRSEVFFFRNKLLSTVSFYDNDRIAGIIISREQMQSIPDSVEATEGLVETIRNIEGVRVSFVARQVEELWRVSLRSHRPEDNVSEVAANFGGGGHMCAAAFKKQIDDFALFLPNLLERLSAVTRVKLDSSC
jgi:phosphoesterase RecJ-like protein